MKMASNIPIVEYTLHLRSAVVLFDHTMDFRRMNCDSVCKSLTQQSQYDFLVASAAEFIAKRPKEIVVKALQDVRVSEMHTCFAC